MGRAYLYGLPEPDRKSLLERVRQHSGKAWRGIRSGLDRAFESLERRGFCVSAGEWRDDVIGVGAPIVTADGVVLAVNCGGPPFDISPRRAEQEVGPKLAHVAAVIAGKSI